jgi:hypothetical protein
MAIPLPRWRDLTFPAVLLSLAILPSPLFAQATGRLDAGGDAQDARTDAMLAMPSLVGTEPLSNLYSTAPGLEQQIPAGQARANLILPLGYNSNAEEASEGGTQTGEFSPLGNVSLAEPIGAAFRFTATGFGDIDRYFQAPGTDLDKVGGSARLQYVDPGNDQGFSPYVAFAPRWQYAPTFSDLLSARQDFNIGFNQRFNFDGSFQRAAISGDSSPVTIWSFGLTVFAQRRLREPQLSSDALFVIPSVSYAMTPDLSASLAVELLGRWFEGDNAGAVRRDWQALPIGTVEYAIPASFLGGERMRKILGRLALDFQLSRQEVWSTSPTASFGQWEGVVALRTGWRF